MFGNGGISRLVFVVGIAAALAATGCETAPSGVDVRRSYEQYDFTTARARLRRDAFDKVDRQVLLQNLRLGMAALADGDAAEAERTLSFSFDLLSTAGLNADRTTAAILLHEGVRVWKGEPFEQALAYYHVAVLHAVIGDWENARAAAANAIFRLTDFGRDQTAVPHGTKAAPDPDHLERGYTAVDTNFALGFLMQAIASELSDAPGADAQFESALKIDPELEPLVDTLRRRAYDTLLLVDYGRGPAKIAYGPDGALSGFVPRDDPIDGLVVSIDDEPGEAVRPVCDVNDMARDHRWNNLEDVRRAKSVLGDALILAGAVVGSGHEDEHELIALGLMMSGAAVKAGARADTRHLDLAPQSVYVVPLRLGRTSEVRVQVGDGTRLVIPETVPGTEDRPRAIYVRLFGLRHRQPEWLTATTHLYGNDHTGVLPGDYPWILGGHDVSTPTRRTLEAYQAGCRLLGYTINDLLALYRAEGIHLGSGMERRRGVRRNPSYRHILEGGSGLFTPLPDSMGYKRLMYTAVEPYEPESDLVRSAARAVRVEIERASRHTRSREGG